MVWVGGCGGTFITNKHILTAAHCKIKKGSKIEYGSISLKNMEEEAIVSEVHIHPKYKPYSVGKHIEKFCKKVFQEYDIPIRQHPSYNN